MFGHLQYNTGTIQPMNLLEATPGFDNESLRVLLKRMATPELEEQVITEANVLNALASKSELVSVDGFDEFGWSRDKVPLSRQVKLSALISDAPHTMGANKKVLKAVDMWAARGLLTRKNIETGGRPLAVLNLNLSKFESPEAVKAEWSAYWNPIAYKLRNEHINKLQKFYSADQWIAKHDFTIGIKSDSTPGAFTTTMNFKKNHVVPLEACIALQSAGPEPDHTKIEPLAGRVLLETESKCERCHHVQTVHTAVSPIQITPKENK